MNKEQEKYLVFNCSWMREQDSSMPYCNFAIPLRTVIVQQGKKGEVSAVQQSRLWREDVLLAPGSCV